MILLFFTTHLKNQKFFLFVLFVIFNFYGAFAQQTININSEQAANTFLRSQTSIQPDNLIAKAEQIRQFNFNSQLKSITSSNKGDILLLDFFENKKYKADRKSVV